MEKKEYLETKVKPVIEGVILESLLKRPKDPVCIFFNCFKGSFYDRIFTKDWGLYLLRTHFE